MLPSVPLSRTQLVLSWAIRILVALILGQTLFFKFSGAPESRYIFARLGMEPWGRIGSGVAELIACIMLLRPRTAPLGAALSAAVLSGAIVSHLTRLGIVVQNDGGLLFGLAIAAWTGSVAIMVLHFHQWRTLLPFGRSTIRAVS